MQGKRDGFGKASYVISMVLALAGCGGSSMAAMATTTAAPAGAAEQSITNNQEQGVDEGGIVKASGDVLIVLRRGRLFTVRVGRDDLSPVCRVDAFPPGSSPEAWYDEMLVHERFVVVVGYSYVYSATELGVFELDPDGCIAHRGTYYLRSNDYYSSRNYASRLVDGRLVFYMPHYLGGRPDLRDPAALLASAPVPALLRHTHDHRRDWEPVITSRDVHVVGEPPPDATLHTVISCDLTRASLECAAHGIVGGAGRTFYVSPRAVYVWTTEHRRQAELPPAVVFRLPLDGQAPSALRAWGAPTDQFSFREDEDALSVLVRSDGSGDWMGEPERTSGSVGLVRMPLRAFRADGASAASWAMYQALPEPTEPGELQNRFVGDYVLYGNGTSWGYPRRGTSARVYAHAYRQGGVPVALELPHGVDRIEALGRDALVAGSDGRDLHMTSIALRQQVRTVGHFVRPNAAQGETRSHGFFFLPEHGRDDGTGILALPVRTAGPGYAHLYHGSAELVFVRVEQLGLDGVGALAAQPDPVDDACRASCTDWYGNARPIFYRGRIFALLGYEIVEGVLRRGRMQEIDRIHLIRDTPAPRPALLTAQ